MSPPASETPFALGYRMPAEWEEHDATWLSWPKNAATFPGQTLRAVRTVYARMVESLAAYETVDLLVDDEGAEAEARGTLGDVGNVRFHRIRTADVWIRDYGPIFVRGRRGVAATKWVFNAWGGKYDDLVYDDRAGAEVARSSGLRVFEAGRVLEGGSIDVNGLGACLTTEQCLLNANRNGGLGRERVEAMLTGYLGATKVVWLKSGIAGDDTDGHVDDIARFVGRNRVVCMVEDETGDENRDALRNNLRLLRSATDQAGERLDVIEMPMPRRVVDSQWGRLPASYANFYVSNGCVLVPTYGDRNDDMAVDLLRELFPGRAVVGIECTPLVAGLGAIHCVTQQQPSAPPPTREGPPRA